MNTGTRTILAAQLTVGREIAASDGYLFTVVAVVRETSRTITVKLASAFSPMSTIRNGVEKTMRKSASYAVVCSTSDDPSTCPAGCSACTAAVFASVTP